jgi:hypothetical protein
MVRRVREKSVESFFLVVVILPTSPCAAMGSSPFLSMSLSLCTDSCVSSVRSREATSPLILFHLPLTVLAVVSSLRPEQ